MNSLILSLKCSTEYGTRTYTFHFTILYHPISGEHIWDEIISHFSMFSRNILIMRWISHLISSNNLPFEQIFNKKKFNQNILHMKLPWNHVTLVKLCTVSVFSVELFASSIIRCLQWNSISCERKWNVILYSKFFRKIFNRKLPCAKENA